MLDLKETKIVMRGVLLMIGILCMVTQFTVNCLHIPKPSVESDYLSNFVLTSGGLITPSEMPGNPTLMGTGALNIPADQHVHHVLETPLHSQTLTPEGFVQQGSIAHLANGSPAVFNQVLSGQPVQTGQSGSVVHLHAHHGPELQSQPSHLQSLTPEGFVPQGLTTHSPMMTAFNQGLSGQSEQQEQPGQPGQTGPSMHVHVHHASELQSQPSHLQPLTPEGFVPQGLTTHSPMVSAFNQGLSGQPEQQGQVGQSGPAIHVHVHHGLDMQQQPLYLQPPTPEGLVPQGPNINPGTASPITNAFNQALSGEPEQPGQTAQVNHIIHSGGMAPEMNMPYEVNRWPQGVQEPVRSAQSPHDETYIHPTHVVDSQGRTFVVDINGPRGHSPEYSERYPDSSTHSHPYSQHIEMNPEFHHPPNTDFLHFAHAPGDLTRRQPGAGTEFPNQVNRNMPAGGTIEFDTLGRPMEERHHGHGNTVNQDMGGMIPPHISAGEFHGVQGEHIPHPYLEGVIPPHILPMEGDPRTLDHFKHQAYTLHQTGISGTEGPERLMSEMGRPAMNSINDHEQHEQHEQHDQHEQHEQHEQREQHEYQQQLGHPHNPLAGEHNHVPAAGVGGGVATFPPQQVAGGVNVQHPGGPIQNIQPTPTLFIPQSTEAVQPTPPAYPQNYVPLTPIHYRAYIPGIAAGSGFGSIGR